MDKYIYIYYEFYKREFLSNLLLSIFAANKNFKIYIGSNNVFNLLRKKKLISPGIFHTKSLTHDIEKTNFHKELKKNNFLITSIDQEHGVIDEGNFDDLFIKSRVEKSDLDLCDAYFCWGKYDYKHLKNKFKKNVFFISGSPRVDLWKKIFNKFWKKDITEKNFVLFVSNFNYPNNVYPYKELIRKREKANYYKRAPNIRKQEIKFLRYQLKSMKKFTNLIEKFSKEFPNEVIFVRPHPTENIEYWNDKFKDHENVVIKSEGDLSSYIRNAKLVVQDGCTSAMESFISNVPIINYVPIKSFKHPFGQFIKKFSINVYNETSFFKLFKNKKYIILKNKKKLVNSRMLYTDKKLSSLKIVEIWNKIYKNKRNLIENNNNLKNNNFKIFIYLFFKQNFNSIITTLVLFIKRKMFLKKIIDHKNQKLDLDEITKNINKLISSLNLKNNLSISKLGKDIIFISSKNKS